MSRNKKVIKRIIKQESSPRQKEINKEVLLTEIDQRIRRLINASLVPFDQRITLLFERIQNVKANVIASNTLLERKGIIEEKEFYREFLLHEREEIGGVDSLGKMEGNPIFSLYNIGE